MPEAFRRFPPFHQYAAAWTPKSFDWEHDDIHDDDGNGNDDDDNDCTFSN